MRFLNRLPLKTMYKGQFNAQMNFSKQLLGLTPAEIEALYRDVFSMCNAALFCTQIDRQ